MRIPPTLGLCESVDFGMSGSSGSFTRHCSDLGERGGGGGGGGLFRLCARLSDGLIWESVALV